MDVVACVHAETSTGVLSPVQAIAAVASEHGALVLVDAVTSFGGHPIDVAGWGLDVRVVQLHGEVHRRAVGNGAGSWDASRTGAQGDVPEFLSRSRRCSRISGYVESITTRSRPR